MRTTIFFSLILNLVVQIQNMFGNYRISNTESSNRVFALYSFFNFAI
ncbi:hypothetical protein CHRYSEO8AT_530015 [Chryseobacterium sp. 8AT]|nr:hypothetical protein CHRYSEO8AT_530015 [Chryseobacterium sp. 8AT]